MSIFEYHVEVPQDGTKDDVWCFEPVRFVFVFIVVVVCVWCCVESVNEMENINKDRYREKYDVVYTKRQSIINIPQHTAQWKPLIRLRCP